MKKKMSLAIIIVGLLAIGLTSPIVYGEEVTGKSEMQSVHFNMKSGNKLSPMAPGEGEVVHVKANRDDYVIVYTNRDWTDIGTWTSIPISMQMDGSGEANFNLWCALTDGRSQNDCMFRFTIKKNDEVIGNVEISDQTVNEEPTEITASASLNATTFESNDKVSIYLEYNGWDNMDVYFDNFTHNSGVQFTCNPLTIYGVSATKIDISLEYIDAFDSDWTVISQFTEVKVGGKPIEGDPEMRPGYERESTNGTITTQLLVWALEEKYDKGTKVTVSISYDGNSTWDSSGEIGKSSIDGVSSDGDEDDNKNIFIGVGVVAVVVVILAVVVIKKRRM